METTAEQLRWADAFHIDADAKVVTVEAYNRMFNHANDCERLIEKTRQQLERALDEIVKYGL